MSTLRTEFDDTEPVPRYSPSGRHRNGSSGLMLISTYVGLFITIASLIFTAGYNWRRISEVAEKHEELAKHVAEDYVRKDVVGAQLEEIKGQLGALQRAAERAAERAAYPTSTR